MLSKRILLVDDEETFARATNELLLEEGFSCDWAAEAESALQLLDRDPYDLLIADIRVQGNTHLELVDAVQGRHDTVPIILVTGYPSVATAIQALEKPVLAYLVKPFEFADLLAKVRVGLWTSERRRVLEALITRSEDLSRELAMIQEASRQPRGDSERVTEACVDIVVRHMMASLDGLRRLAVAGGSGGGDMQCLVPGCAREAQYRAMLRRVTDVLEGTKSSFKSKELGELRKAIDEFVRLRDY